MDFSASPATSAPPGFGENIDFSSPFYTPAATTDSVSGPSETLHTSNAVIGSGAPSSTPAAPSIPEDAPAPSTSASASTSASTSTSTSFAAPQAYDAYSEMFPSLPTAKPGTFKPAPPPVSYAPLKSRDHVDRFQIDPAQLRPSGIGEKAHSEICKAIMHETGSKIEFSSAKNGTMTVIVSGKPENVANAKKKILAALSKQYELKVEVPREHLSALIGKQGTKLKSLQDKTGARLQVPKAEEEKDFVVISGSKASVEQARIEVLEFLKEKSNFVRESVKIEPNFQPFVYGPGNETLKEISLETGAKIHVPPSDSTETDIIVAGPREAVAEALKKIQNIYTEKKRTTKSASIIVNKKQHRFIIGVKGVNIQEILKTTGCLVSVPPLESTSDVITVSGDESKILPALQLVMEKANSVCVEEIKIEGAHLQRYIKVKGRQQLKELEKDTKVQISYTSPILDIQGPKEEVEKVRNAVINQLAEFKKLKFDEVEVAQDLRKFLIGKNGGNIKKIKTDHNVDVFVPHEDEESEYRTVLLAGEKDKIKIVKDQILKNAKEWANLTVIEFKVESKFHKTIIGKKGETIKKLNEDFENCSIKVPASEDESNIVTLRGPKDEVEKLHKLIVKLVEETRHYEVMHNYTEEIYIDKKAIKYIVGKGGVAINKLREIHDVKIEIDNPKEQEAKEAEKEKEKEKEKEAEKPKEAEKGKGKGKDTKDAKDAKEDKPKPKTGRENSEKVIIQGVKKNVEEAKAALLAKAKEILEGGGMVTVELHIDPKFHGNLIGAQGKFVRSLSERHSVNVRFPRGDAPSDIVTISGLKTSVDKAQAELLELLEYEKSLSFTQTITANNSVLRHIFGLNDSSKLKLIQIMEQTKTQVDFQNNDKEGNVIVIKGTEKAVAESKKLVEKLIEEVSNTVTEEVEVDTQYHGIIIGVRGARVRELSEKHLVDIKFPLDKTSKVIRVKGFRANVDAAKAAILDVVKGIENEKASQVTKSFDIPKKYYPGLKEFIRNHTNELPVRITLPKDNEDSEAVILKGKEEDIEKSIALLKDNLEETLVIQIPRDLHRNIVSDGKVKKLNQDLKVVVRFPDRDSKSSDVSIRGKADAIAEAAKILSQYAEVAAQPRVSETQAPVRENPDRQQETIKVNPEYFGKIIGKGGKTIRNLSDVSGIKIDLKKEAGEIVLSGTREGIEFAKRELNELIKELESRATEVLDVPQAFHPRLAGVKFSNLYKIQDDFEVSIRLDRESDKVSVTGNKEDVKAAVSYIRELIKEIKFDLDQATSAREKRESSNASSNASSNGKEKEKSRAPAYDAAFFAPPPQSTTTTVDRSSVWGARLN